MAGVVPKMPWRTKLRIHGKAIAQALPIAFLLVVEGRDLFYRATWEPTYVPPTKFDSGDVIVMCNRWYTLPAWGQKLYSLLSKALFKSCWDDVAVISRREGNTPHVLFSDFSGVHEMALDEFLETRKPRGAAVRKLKKDSQAQASTSLCEAVVPIFIDEVSKIKPRSWYLFSASMRSGDEHKYYETCVAMNAQRQHIRDMVERGQSRKAVLAQQEKLQNMEAMRQRLEMGVHKSVEFCLYNGSLVASFLAAMGFLDREMPQPSRYVPQDFSYDLPFKGTTTLEEPIIFFKD